MSMRNFFGDGVTVNDSHAAVFGSRCTVNGNHCQVFGDRCIVNGNHCQVMGDYCVVNGNHCQVMGKNCTVNGRHASSSSSSSPAPPPGKANRVRDRERDRSPTRKTTPPTSFQVGHVTFHAPGGVATPHAKNFTISAPSGHVSNFANSVVFYDDESSSVSDDADSDVVVVNGTRITGSFVGINHGAVMQVGGGGRPSVTRATSSSSSSSSSSSAVAATAAAPPPPPAPAVPSVPEPFKGEEPSAREGESECSVCTDRAVKTVCVPCGHQCLCVTCAIELVNVHHKHNCPICAKRLVSVISTFVSGATAAVPAVHP